MEDLETRKGRATARRQAVRDITRKVASDLHEAAAVEDLELFIKKPTVYKTRRPEVEKQMSIRTAGLLYSGHHPGLRLGAAIALSRGYSKTDFAILREHAKRVLTEERIGRLNDCCPLDSPDTWFGYSKHLQGEQTLLVLASLGWDPSSVTSCQYSLILVIWLRICVGVRF